MSVLILLSLNIVCSVQPRSQSCECSVLLCHKTSNTANSQFKKLNIFSFTGYFHFYNKKIQILPVLSTNLGILTRIGFDFDRCLPLVGLTIHMLWFMYQLMLRSVIYFIYSFIRSNQYIYLKSINKAWNLFFYCDHRAQSCHLKLAHNFVSFKFM